MSTLEMHNMEVVVAEVTAPTAEPVEVEEVKRHLRITDDFEDPLLKTYVTAARKLAEKATKRQLMTATYDLFLHAFPCEIVLPRPPLQSVASVKYLDTGGTQTTLATSVYTTDTNRTPGRITLAYNQSWPSIRAIENTVEILYVCGYTAAVNVPEGIRMGILMLTAHWWRHREAFVDKALLELPVGYEALFASDTNYSQLAF